MEIAEHERLNLDRFFHLVQEQLLIRILIGMNQEIIIHLFTAHNGITRQFTYASCYNYRLECRMSKPSIWAELTRKTAGDLFREWAIDPDKAYRQGWLTTKQISVITESHCGPAAVSEYISADALVDFGRLQEKLQAEILRWRDDGPVVTFMRRLEKFLKEYKDGVKTAVQKVASLAPHQ